MTDTTGIPNLSVEDARIDLGDLPLEGPSGLSSVPDVQAEVPAEVEFEDLSGILGDLTGPDPQKDQYRQNQALTQGLNQQSAGKIMDVAAKSGLSPQLVQQDLPTAQIKAFAPGPGDEMENAVEKFGSNSPYHVALIQSEAPVFNGIINNWNKTAGFFKKTVANAEESYRQSTINEELNALYHNKFFNDDDSKDPRILSLEQKRKPVETDDLFQDIVSATFDALPQIEAGLLRAGAKAAAGAVTFGSVGLLGGPAALFSAPVGAIVGGITGLFEQSFIQESGAAIREFNQIEGVSRTEAKIAAGISGVLSASVEMVGTGLLAKTIPGAAKLLSVGSRKLVGEALARPLFKQGLSKIGLDYFIAIAGNAAEEGLQSIIQDETRNLLDFVSGDKPTYTPALEVLEKAGKAAKQGGLAAIGLGSVGTVSRVLVEKIQADRAKNFYETQIEIGEQISKTGMKSASPEGTQQLLQGAEADRTLSIAPEETTVLLQENKQELFEKVGISEKEIEDSLRTGQDLDTTLSAVFAKLDNEEIKEFLKFAREDPNGKSFNEAQAFNLDEAVKRQIDIQKEAQVEEIELQNNLSRLVNEVREAGFKGRFAKDISSIWESYSRRVALEGQELAGLVKRLTVRKATKEDLETVTRIQAETEGFESIGMAPLPRGLLLKDNDKFIISLLEGAEESTISHETAHVFFSEIKGLALDHKIESFQEEWSLIKEWLDSGDNPNVANEEKFAEGFEQYLLEGKAPTKKLEKVFDRFKNWMVQIYGKEGVSENVKLNDDIKGVFNRLLETEKEVNGFLLDQELIPSESTVTALELTEAQEKVLQTSLRKNGREANLNTLERRIRKELFKQRPIWKEQAQDMVNALPVYRLWDDLSKGTIRGFDRKSVEELYGKNTTDKLKAKNNRFVIRGGNTDVELALQDYVVEPQTAADLIRELVEVLPAEVRRNELIRGFEKDFLKNLTAEESFLSWSQGLTGYLETLGGFISKKAGLEVTPSSEFKAEVEDRIAVEPISKILDTNTALIAMRKALREKDAAIKKGDFVEADKLMRKARYNYELARASKDLRDSVRKTRNKVRNAVKSKKKMPPAYQENIKALGVRYGFVDGVISKTKVPLKSLITDISDTDLTQEPIFDDFLINEAETKPFKDMAVAEYEELAVMIEYLDGKGRFIVKDVLLEQGMKREALIAELVKPSNELKTRKIFNEGSVGRTISQNINNFYAINEQFIYITKAMDAFTNLGRKNVPGPNERFIWRAFSDASDSNFVLTEKVDTQLKPALDQLFKSALTFPQEIVDGMPRRPDLWTKQGRQWTFENVVGIARLMGLEGNRKAVKEGFGLTDAEIQQALSILTDADWDAIQTIWDTFDTLWPESQRIREEVEFLPTKKIPPSPYRTPTGKIMKGGYHPLDIDWTLAQKARPNENLDNLKAMYPKHFPTASTKSGSKMLRKGFAGLPPQTSWHVLFKQMAWNVRYISHTELARDMSRLFARNGDYYNQVVDKMGKPVADLLIAINKHEAVPDAILMSKFDRISLWLRNIGTTLTLAQNIGVGIKQFFSLFNALGKVGHIDYVNGLLTYLKDPVKNSKLVLELSPFMAQRAGSGITREIAENAANLKSVPTNKFTSSLVVYRKVVEFANWMWIRSVDAIVVRPLWFATYKRGMRETGGNHTEAVARANEIIQSTQPNNRFIDQSALQSSPRGLLRWFTMFSSFMFTYGNQRDNTFRAWKAGKMNTFDFGVFIFEAALLSPALIYLLFQWGRGDDLEWEELALTILLFNGGTKPFARDILNAGVWTYKTGRSDDFWKNPAFTALEFGQDLVTSVILLFQDLDSEDRMDKAIWAFANIASIPLKTPAAKLYKQYKEGIRQFEEGEDFDRLFNIFSPSPEKRRQGRKGFTRF